jgi:hypothetical protein
VSEARCVLVRRQLPPLACALFVVSVGLSSAISTRTRLKLTVSMTILFYLRLFSNCAGKRKRQGHDGRRLCGWCQRCSRLVKRTPGHVHTFLAFLSLLYASERAILFLMPLVSMPTVAVPSAHAFAALSLAGSTVFNFPMLKIT